MTETEKAERARDRYNFWVAAGPGGLFVYVPHGTDPTDGAPLTMAKQATPVECQLWQMERFDQLARLLYSQGAGVRLPGPKRWPGLRKWVGGLLRR